MLSIPSTWQTLDCTPPIGYMLTLYQRTKNCFEGKKKTLISSFYCRNHSALCEKYVCAALWRKSSEVRGNIQAESPLPVFLDLSLCLTGLGLIKTNPSMCVCIWRVASHLHFFGKKKGNNLKMLWLILSENHYSAPSQPYTYFIRLSFVSYLGTPAWNLLHPNPESYGAAPDLMNSQLRAPMRLEQQLLNCSLNCYIGFLSQSCSASGQYLLSFPDKKCHMFKRQAAFPITNLK